MEALMDIISTSEHQESPAPVQLTYAESGTQWSSYDDSDSVSSKESEHSKDSEHSKLGNFFRKAKERGKRLVHRRKKKTKIIMVDQTFQTDTSLFETLEETASAPHLNFPMSNDTETETEIGTPPPTTPPPTTPLQSTTTFSQSPADLQSEVVHEGAQEPTHPVKPPLKRRISFKKFRLVFGLFLLFLTFLLPFWVASFLWGVFISMSTFVYLFIAQATAPPRNEPSPEMIESIAKEIARQKVLKQAIRYRGWMNELRRRYNPLDYSVNMTQSVVVELEGRTLRIARPKKNVIKHTFFNDPTLKVPEPPMIKSRAYDLMNADIKLRPHGLARRRWWNRKYPILILLAPQKEDIVVDGNGDDSDSDYSQSDNEYLNDIPISEESDLRRRWTISKSTHDDSFVKSRDDSFVKSREVSFAKATEERHSRRGSTKSGARRKKIILFPRSSREKERWFHRLREASSLHQTATGTAFDVNERKASNLSLPTIFDQSTISGAAGVNISIEYYLYVSYGMEFAKTMAEVMKSSSVEHLPESGIIHMNLDQCIWTPKNADFKSEVVLAANALVARLFFDFCRDERWIHVVRSQIETKLATLELPHFIETLTLSQLKLGTTTPQVIGVHSPVVNDWGLWVDVEIKYEGGLELGFETKLDLVTMVEEKKGVFRKITLSRVISNDRRHYSDDELSISPENSANEDFGGSTAGDIPSGGMGKKILNVIDKISKSDFFHNVAELGPIKKIMEEISTTCLMLNVEVTHLEGTLAINLPPPPSDRIWFGFRRPPQFSLKAVPQVGDRVVDMSTVSAWIENKLHMLLEKHLVVPNMGDLVCPLMAGNEMFKFGYNN